MTNKKATILSLFAVFFLLISCGENKPIQDEQLSSFMLGGIYFIHGYGGMDEVNSMLSDYTTNEELISGYKELFEFPFNNTSQKSGSKSLLKNMWDITDKSSLLASINDLQTREGTYKSWDYARIINNACIGYSAGYLTKEEVIETISKIVPLAQEKYANWEDYFTDFNLGRLDWNAEDEEGAGYLELSKTIYKGEKSIYKILPLHPKK